MPLFENSRRESSLVVTVHETLPDVLARLRQHAGDVVSVEIPDGSPLFLTAGEFRSLREVAQQRRVALTVITDDALRHQLAGVFGLTVQDPRQPTPAGLTPPPPVSRADMPKPVPNAGLDRMIDSPSRDFRTGTDRDRDAASRRPLSDREREIWPRGRPSSAPAPVPNRLPGPEPDDYDRRIADTFTGEPPVVPADDASPVDDVASRGWRPVRWPDRNMLAPGDGQSRGHGSRATPDRFVAPADETALDAEAGRPVPPAISRRPSRLDGWNGLSPRAFLGLIAIGLVALIVLGYLFVIFAFSSARVTLALESGSVNASVDCQIVGPGERGNAPVVVQGQTVKLHLTYKGSVPTTGTRSIPDTPASGRVQFANPTDKDITVSSDTELTAHIGQKYRVQSDVTIAASDAAGGPPGTGEAVVSAVNKGTVSNLPVGGLSGRLDNGLYYSNRNVAIDGGTDQTIQTVKPVDIQNGHSQADQQLAAVGDSPDIPSGAAVVPSTIVLSDQKYQDDLQSGADGGALTTTATATASALVYNDADLRRKVTAALLPALQQQVPNGFQLSQSTVALTTTRVTGQTASGASLAVQGTASTTAVLTDSEAASLADQLAGKSDSDARHLLDENARISSYTIDYSPGWIPDRMPGRAGRIQIEEMS